MGKSGVSSSSDVAIAAAVFAVWTLAVRVSTYVLPLDSSVYLSPGYSLVAGLVPLIGLYWVLGRCWWLMRSDGGQTTLMGSGLCAMAIYDIYINLWGLAHYAIPASYVGFIDIFVSATRVVGLVLVILALVHWSRTPAWFTPVAYSYIVIFLLGSLGRRFMPVFGAASGFANVLFMLALAASLFVYGNGHGRSATQRA